MSDVLWIGGFIALWLIAQVWLLPKLGIPT
jgi:hypothetical protein